MDIYSNSEQMAIWRIYDQIQNTDFFVILFNQFKVFKAEKQQSSFFGHQKMEGSLDNTYLF